MASSSSSFSKSWKYHVFLSFRGEDTRKTFVDHLYFALEQQGINTYKDDETLPRGESIGASLIKAIEESQIAVIVFSENYAFSSWCLDELVCIMRCKDTKGLIVLPIFYDVDPSIVRKQKQKQKYGQAFTKHELEKKFKVKCRRKAFVDDPWGWVFAPREQKRKYQEAYAKHVSENKTKVESWRKALVDASNISGWETKHIANGNESKGIKQIVVEISQKLHLATSGANEKLIGMAARLQDLRSELQVGSGGVCIIGIWGVGGGGKTTLASSIYDEICRQFDGCCFVQNIREESSRYGLGKLEEGILSKMGINKDGGGRCMIKDRLCHRKVLIVLDDVDSLEQLKALAGSHDWFGEGSRIIITTRDKHLLTAHKVNVIHTISLLKSDEAIKLFCKHAHRDYTSMGDYEQLSEEVVCYAGGLPLALTVLGSFLCDKNIQEWRSALVRLKEIPDADLLEKLKISFDGLEQSEKDLFLDIACFFRGRDKVRAMEILGACGFHPVIGVNVLIQKALITISYGRFDMHDLVQEMAHYIVRGKDPKNPEKHSRVWRKEDVLTICAMEASTELDIEAIRLECCRQGEQVQRHLQIAAKMKSLRWIDWEGDLASPMLSNLLQRNLCCLILKNSLQEQLWEGYKLLPNLKTIELLGLDNLIITPDFSGLPNLERFILARCFYLREIHSSIGCLERLVFLSIASCCRLKVFPPITRLRKLVAVSACPNVFSLSEIQQQNMENLRHLDLDNSGGEVASYIESSTNSSVLRDNNMNDIWLQFFLRDLRHLHLRYCNLGDKDVSFSVWELPNLKTLDLTGNDFSRLKFSLWQFPQLKWLDVSCCKDLVELQELPPNIAVVIASDCILLETLAILTYRKQ